MIKYLESTSIVFKLSGSLLNKALIGRVNYTIPYDFKRKKFAYTLNRRCTACNKFFLLGEQLPIKAQNCKNCGIRLFNGF